MSTPRDRMKERLVDALNKAVTSRYSSLVFAHDFGELDEDGDLIEPDFYDVVIDADKLADRVLADAAEILAEEEEADTLAMLADPITHFATNDSLKAENEALKAELAKCQAAMRAVVAFYQDGGSDQ